MMYSNKVVAAIKVNGEVLREDGDTVTIPFGSEYNILLKNLNSVRIQVRVSVDGKNATEGTWLIIQPNSSLELERFIHNGNLNSGNRFKFIERTRQIEKHRGIKAEDGLIRVEYKTERAVVTKPRINYYDEWVPRPHYYDPYWYYRPYWPGVWSSNTVTYNSSGNVSGSITQDNAMGDVVRCCNMQSSNTSSIPNESGITVAGSESQQKFYNAPSFETETQSQVIVLKLRGCVGGKKVKKAITVKHKPTCDTCGKSNKANVKFCGQCGTAISII